MDDTSRLIDVRLHQIVRDLGLSVDHHDFAVRVFWEIKSFKPAIEGDVDAFMDKPLAVHTLARFGFPQQVCHTLFDHPGADTTCHIFTAATLQNDCVDSLKMKQACQQQTRWTRTDNSNLSSH